MKLFVKCKPENKDLIEDYLHTHGIGISGSVGPYILAEKGLEDDFPESSIVISFHSNHISALDDFLLSISATLISNENKAINNEVVICSREESFELIKVEQVFYFEAEGDYTYCKTENERLKVKMKLYKIEQDYSSKGFIRINKSIIVNVLRVNEIVPWFGGRILLRFDSLDVKLEVSRNYTKKFKSYLGM